MNIGYFEAEGRALAVTLVVHGLNVRGEAMMSYVRLLTGRQSDVFLLSLAGHYGGVVNLELVRASLWRAEMQKGYERARQRATELAVPLYFLGYSLGALLGQSQLLLHGARFDRQVLVAPAIALRWHCYLVKGLFFLGERQRLPSYSPRPYRVHQTMPLRIYQILFDEVRKLADSRFRSLEVPSLIIMDPGDELISYRKIKALRKEYGWPHCSLLTLNPSLRGRSTYFHHCLLDAGSMGADNWALTTREIDTFLFGGYSDQNGAAST